MDVKGIVEILQDRPVVFSRRYRNTRVAHLRVFPYAIHYLIEEQKVVVLGVFHTSIDPDKWDERRYNPKVK
jgi:hypothetical protein